MKVRVTAEMYIDVELTDELAEMCEVIDGSVELVGDEGEWDVELMDHMMRNLLYLGKQLEEATLFDWTPVCRECGCTNDEACDGGCTWIEPDLCSTHRPHLAELDA